MEDKLYAFWRHDQFPFILGGPVTKMRENGSVETKNFGPGYYFKPFKVVPLKAGLMLQQHLDSMEHKFRAAEKEFRLQWKREGDKLFKMINDGEAS